MRNRKTKQLAVSVLLLTAILYVVGALVSKSFDPFHWHVAVRLVIAPIWGMTTIYCYLFFSIK